MKDETGGEEGGGMDGEMGRKGNNAKRLMKGARESEIESKRGEV